MNTFRQIGSVRIYLGDCLEILTNNPEISGVSAVVTDPPYGLSAGATAYLEESARGRGFMGALWDRGVPGQPFWSAIRHVCKPGAYLLAFGGTRTYHRQTVAIEDSGFMIRDCLMWCYGSGFPKSLDLSKALDGAAGADRPVVMDNPNLKGRTRPAGNAVRFPLGSTSNITAPATPAAQTWSGYGTALKPALEPIVLAMNPRAGSFVENVLTHKCGGLNIDGCRIQGLKPQVTQGINSNPTSFQIAKKRRISGPPTEGRWPANLLIDDSAEVVGLFPESNPSGAAIKGKPATAKKSGMFFSGQNSGNGALHADRGSAARFFYCAKASRLERELGCEELDPLRRSDITGRAEDSAGQNNPRSMARATGEIRNTHPTVKPIAVMRYLVRLVTQPEENLILDPFAGSGTTGVAAALAGLECVLIEQDPRHFEICCARVQWATDLRARLGREPELDLSPYTKRSEPAAAGDTQTSLF